MSDYTPSTEEVRGRHNANAMLETKTWRAVDAEFDRWLRAVKAESWDEGFDSGHYVNDDESRDCDCRNNPYTKENNA